MNTHRDGPLEGIGQIAIRVRDLDRAVEFYRDRLGLLFLFRVPAMAFFRDPDRNLMALMDERPREG